MAIKNAIYKVDNGSSFDDIYFKTSATQVVEDSTHRFTTDTEKAAWNGKASTTVATTAINGLMSNAMVTKLNGIATGANAYAHPNTHPATMITEDSAHRFTTDTEKATWNGKASTTVATITANGLMSNAMVTKLNGIATGANAYVHPSAHPATMIAEDTAHRFTTDTEKTVWNGKASTAVATTAVNGLMSNAMVTKLDSIAAGANAYTHPSTHPASMIVEDTNHRFVSENEKAVWNGKANNTLVTINSNGLMSKEDKAILNNIMRVKTFKYDGATLGITGIIDNAAKARCIRVTYFIGNKRIYNTINILVNNKKVDDWTVGDATKINVELCKVKKGGTDMWVHSSTVTSQFRRDSGSESPDGTCKQIDDSIVSSVGLSCLAVGSEMDGVFGILEVIYD